MLKIKEYRGKKGYSQKELADLLSIKQNTLSQYESGTREPDLETLTKMSIVLETTIEEIIDFKKLYDKLHDELYEKIQEKEKELK